MKYTDLAVTVSDLNRYIKDKIADDENLNQISVKGEISNFKNHLKTLRSFIFFSTTFFIIKDF